MPQSQTFLRALFAIAPAVLAAVAGCSNSEFGSKGTGSGPIAKSTAAAALPSARKNADRETGSKDGTPAADPDVARTTVPNIDPTAATLKVSRDEVSDLGCDLEDAQGTFTMKASSDALHFVSVAPSCSKTVTTSSTSEVKYPLDVVFVLDITSSMEANLLAVKENVARFADTLSQRGWAARFAAVGFRDTVDERLDFRLSTALAAGVGQWVSAAGADLQEAGQDGIRAGLDLFASGGVVDAKKVILLVTDNPFYASASNHSDFSVTALASRMKAELPADARLFCSVPVRAAKLPVSPMVQCDEIRAQSGLGGTNLPFPLSATVVLDQFAGTFETKNTAQVETCSLVKAQIVDASALGGGALAGQPFPSDLAGMAESAPSRISLGDSAAVSALTGAKALRVERCCRVSVAASGENTSQVGSCASLRIKYVRF